VSEEVETPRLRPPCPTCGCRLYVEYGPCEGDRLRSDEWLEAAAREIGAADEDEAWSGIQWTRASVVDVLRKHRDGKA
jgi:hypothetical protein